MVSPNFAIGKLRVGPEFPPLVIPELGINHGGSLDLAKSLVTAAADSGAKIVKIQTHIVDEEMLDTGIKPASISAEPLWDIIERCSLSSDEERDLFHFAQNLGLEFLSTPFSVAAVERLDALGVSAFKIGSGEVSNTQVLEAIARRGKPAILSTGMHEDHELKTAVEILKSKGCDVTILHCVSIYPTPYSKMTIDTVTRLRETFPNCPVGISDHAPTIWPSLGAVALGARVIEKHFTLTRALPGPDMAVSIEPGELSMLIEASRAIWECRGERTGLIEGEGEVRAFAQSSVVVTETLKKGGVLQDVHLKLMRPAQGDFHAMDLSWLVGSRLARDVNAGTFLRREDIAT